MFARMEHHMEEHSDEVLALTAWQCAVLAVAMIGWALFDVHGDVPALLATASSYSFSDMGYLVWTGLFTTAAVLWGETKVMQDVSGTQAGIIFATEPLFATVSDEKGGWKRFGMIRSPISCPGLGLGLGLGSGLG